MMTTIRNKIAFMLTFLLWLTACSDQQKPKTEGNELKLKVTVSSFWGIGYGMIYHCNVKSVEKGMLADKKISLLLMDQEYDEIMLKKGASPEIRTITFRKKGKNKKDHFPFDTGFIGKNRTEWEVVSLK